MTLRVALVGGPMYDGLYEMFDRESVEVVVHADHPTLNRSVAEMLGNGERIDVISTHSKYMPSQRNWLFDLGEVIDTTALARRAVELCAYHGAQYCVPRNIDVRILWANRRLVGDVPTPSTWTELAASKLAFGFSGRESGLFGTLFEIVDALGGQLFDETQQPQLNSEVVVASLALLRIIATHAPSTLPQWHYDDVDLALGNGEIALAAAWPGATTTLRSTNEGANLDPFPYFGNNAGPRSYAGCHAWAIPKSCGDFDAAIDLVARLTSLEMQQHDALSGSVCAHREAFAAVVPIDVIDARRLAITEQTISTGMLTYPPMESFPAIEDAAWSAIHAMLCGELNEQAVAERMQAAAVEVLDRR